MFRDGWTLWARAGLNRDHWRFRVPFDGGIGVFDLDLFFGKVGSHLVGLILRRAGGMREAAILGSVLLFSYLLFRVDLKQFNVCAWATPP